MSKIVLCMIFVCSVSFLNILAQDIPEVKGDFYEKYPVYKTFFPFGVYGGLENAGYTSSNLDYMDDDHGYRFQLENLRENYLNFMWGASLDRNMKLEKGRYVLDENGRSKVFWAKKLEFRFMPTFWYWFAPKRAVGEVFKELKGKNKWLTNQEIDKIVKKHQVRFEAMRLLRRELGDLMIGLAFDDEPASVVKSYLSVERALKPFVPDLPIATVTGPTHHLTAFLPYVELISTESYGRNKWGTRDQFLEYYRRSPNTVVWNDILTGSYGAEPTLPSWPDAKPTVGEMRLAFWQSLAGGAKGFFSYLYRMRPSWWVGDDSFVNTLGRETKNNGISVMRETGREFTAIGPLLLTTRPVKEEIAQIHFKCRRLDFLEFKGLALDCGVLQDKNEPRRYIIVYNNNIDTKESGVMTLPAEWLKETTLYDLHKLSSLAPMDGANNFTIEPLRAGEGRIFLIANEKEFEKCKRTILFHRIRNELFRLDIRIRELKPIADRGWLPGKEKKKLVKTIARLTDGVATTRRNIKIAGTDFETENRKVRKLFSLAENIRNEGSLGIANRKFKIIEDAVMRLDDLIECHTWELFGYTPLSRTYYRHVARNQRLIFEYRDLIVKYFAAKNVYWRGGAGSELNFLLDNYAREAKELLATYRKTIDESFDRQRQPVQVLFLTPKQNNLEYIETFAWLYKNFPAVYGYPTPDGRILDRNGKAISLDKFDVVWIHSVKTPRPLPEKNIQPANVIPKEFLTPKFLSGIGTHLKKGKSLLLTGLASMYVLPLELEKTPPNIIRSQSAADLPLLQGFAACPGYTRHPVFQSNDPNSTLVNTNNLASTMGKPKKFAPCPNALGPYGKGTQFRFEPTGFYTTGEFPKMNYYCECTWKNEKPQGRVIADVYDSTLGSLGGYAGIVEYGGYNGHGKVLVVGAMPFDLSPGISYYPQFSTSWKCFVRGLVYNMLCYLGGTKTYQEDKKEAGKSKMVRKDLAFLPTVWKFKLDPDNKGETEKWFRKDIDDNAWQDIRIGSSWESQGHDYDGNAWYRTTFKIPDRFRGKRVFLVFGAADEQAWVYVNGRLLGKGGASPQDDGLGWAKPFRFDISEQAKGGNRPLQLTVRVLDSMAAGGIWKPVYLVTEE